MFMVIWEFVAKRQHAAEFEAVYGPEGSWAELFRRMGGRYLGTELIRDLRQPHRYLCIDRWSERAAYEQFQREHREEYQALDRECELLTERETALGSFEEVA